MDFSPTQAFLKVVQQNLAAPDPKVIRQLRSRRLSPGRSTPERSAQRA